jgi:hypothetical protein
LPENQLTKNLCRHHFILAKKPEKTLGGTEVAGPGRQSRIGQVSGYCALHFKVLAPRLPVQSTKHGLYVWTYLTWHNFLKLFFRKIFEEVFCAASIALKRKEFL